MHGRVSSFLRQLLTYLEWIVQCKCMGLISFYPIADPFKTQRLLEDFVEHFLRGHATMHSDLDPRVDTFEREVRSAEEFNNGHKTLPDTNNSNLTENDK